MNKKELRIKVLSAVKSANPPNDVMALCRVISGFGQPEVQAGGAVAPSKKELNTREAEFVLEIVRELISSKYLIEGYDKANPTWPSFRVCPSQHPQS